MQPVRAHRLFLVLGILLSFGAALTLSGENDTSENKPTEEWRKKLDRDALRAMTREERRAAVRNHRAEQEAAAHQAGIEQGSPGYRPLQEPRPVAKREALLVPGTSIQYDSGVVTGFIALSTSGLAALNRFDSALNANGTAIEPVQASGSITMITFDMLRTSGDTVTLSLYSGVVGTSAMQVTSFIVPAATGLNTVNVGGGTTINTYMGSSFLAGIWQFNTAFTRIGVDSNSAAGQGFHAVSLNEPQTGATNTGMGLGTLGSINFVYRVSGNVATPVELMNFEIE